MLGNSCVPELMESRMKLSRRFSIAFLLVTFIAARVWTARATTEEGNSIATTDAQIFAEIHDHSELMDNLEYLSDRIGPRLTGYSTPEAGQRLVG